MGAYIAFELTALGGEVSERRGEFAKQALGGRKRGFGLRHALVDAAALLDARFDLFLQLGIFGVEPLECRVGVGGLLLFTRDVGGKLRQPAIEFGDAFLGAGLLAIKRLAGVGQALQACGGAGLGLAQRRQFGSADRLDAGGFRLFAGALRHLADRKIVDMRGLRYAGLGFDPAQMIQQGFGLAHLGGDLAVTDGLAGLFLEAVDLSRQLPDHVLDTGEVGLGRLQPQLSLVAAGMKPGDTGGIFEHAAALFGFGLNDLTNLALVDQRRRARAGCGIGEQQLYVAGAHVAAIDAIDRSGLAFDATGNFQVLAVVDGRGRRALRIIDRHHHFGVVARGPVAGARENHRIHVGGAQRFVRGLAHRPAQRFHQIGFAAAVRADDAGQAGLDHEVGGFDERLETVKAKTGQLHRHRFSVGRARISLPGQYHRRQCRCVG